MDTRPPIFAASAHVTGEDVVELLLKHGADASRRQGGYFPLCQAALAGRPKVAKLLLEHGCYPNLAIREGFTPLFMACENGHMTMVEELVKYGANVDAVTTKGKTPICEVIARGDLAMITYLFKHGASVNAIVAGRFNPMYQAVQAERGKEVVLLLIKFGADVATSEESDGNSPLHLAGNNGLLEIAEALLDAGAPIDAFNFQNKTPLNYACEFAHLDLARFLLIRGAQVNPPGVGVPLAIDACLDYTIRMPRMSKLELDAFWGRKGEILNELITHGVDVNALHPRGSFSALMLAKEITDSIDKAVGESMEALLLAAGASSELCTPLVFPLAL